MARRGGGSLSNSNCVSIENELGNRIDIERTPDGEITQIDIYDYDVKTDTEFLSGTLYPETFPDGSDGWRLEMENGDISYFDTDGFRVDENGDREYGEDSLATELGFDVDTFDMEDLNANDLENQDMLDQGDGADREDHNPDGDPGGQEDQGDPGDHSDTEPPDDGNDGGNDDGFDGGDDDDGVDW